MSDAGADSPRVGQPPHEFDTYQFILLRWPDSRPSVTDEEADRLQALHLGHLEAIREQGFLMVAGPLSDQEDERLRGIAIYRVESLDRARELAESDPAVVAGRLEVDAMTWSTRKGRAALLARYAARDRLTDRDRCRPLGGVLAASGAGLFEPLSLRSRFSRGLLR